jgi:hypothetical protein
MQNLLLKLGVNSQLEAVAFAVEHGLWKRAGRWSGNALLPSNSGPSLRRPGDRPLALAATASTAPQRHLGRELVQDDICGRNGVFADGVPL